MVSSQDARTTSLYLYPSSPSGCEASWHKANVNRHSKFWGRVEKMGVGVANREEGKARHLVGSVASAPYRTGLS